MNFKTATLFFIIMHSSTAAFSQGIPGNQKLPEEHTYSVTSTQNKNTPPVTHPIYRDTRLGGSSPLYNTYKKNDYGAGAITTNPNKDNGIAKYPGGDSSSNNLITNIYRDTRLGGSSPLYNTYKKNDYGAGTITTNPNK